MKALWASAVLLLGMAGVPVVGQSGAVSTTVSVPLADGDSATVTGTLAVRHRGTQDFLVLESPTPYSLVHDHQAGEHSGKVVRDIPFALAGRNGELKGYEGQVLSATGHVRFEPASKSWNGALLESSVVILPGGKELRAKR